MSSKFVPKLTKNERIELIEAVDKQLRIHDFHKSERTVKNLVDQHVEWDKLEISDALKANGIELLQKEYNQYALLSF